MPAFSDKGEIYIYLVTFWGKYVFLIIPVINNRDFTLNQLVHVGGEFCIILVFIEILHQINFLQVENPHLK